MVKTYQLREKDEAGLVEELNKNKNELAKLRVGKVATATQVKVAKIRVIRKDIARILTVINQKRREKARTDNKGKKFKPLDLRSKKIRKMRKSLTTTQLGLKTLRQRKRELNFPLRKYAIQPQN